MRTRSRLAPRPSTRPAVSRGLAAAAVAAVALVAFAPAASAGPIEAVKGKKYALTKKHGPWMIMVAAFSAPPPGERTAGMTPEQAADELVYELRSKGLPAYTWAMDGEIEKVETIDRLGEPDTRIYAARRGSVCVVAGNYKSIDLDSPDRTLKAEAAVAHKSLEWVKAFRPKFLQGGKADEHGLVTLPNGGAFRSTPGKKGPLGGAFLTTNPVLTPEEVRGRRTDPLLVRLNAGGDLTLLDNKGTYTLVVASFYGNSATQAGGRTIGQTALTDALDHAANDAWQLAKALRKEKNIEAYVWHDRYKSVVTVGAFDEATDLRIVQEAQKYAAKMRVDPTTGKEVLTAEMMTLPLRPTPTDPVRQQWIFDPQPTLMPVPKF